MNLEETQIYLLMNVRSISDLIYNWEAAQNKTEPDINNTNIISILIKDLKDLKDDFLSLYKNMAEMESFFIEFAIKSLSERMEKIIEDLGETSNLIKFFYPDNKI